MPIKRAATIAFLAALAVFGHVATNSPGVRAQEPKSAPNKLVNLKDLGRDPFQIDVWSNRDEYEYSCGDKRFKTSQRCLEFLSKQADEVLKDGLLVVSHTKTGDDADQIRTLFRFAEERTLDVFVAPAFGKFPQIKMLGLRVYWYPAEQAKGIAR